MGVGVLDSTLDTTEIALDEIFDADSQPAKGNANNLDARRRLEDKIEELRLQRELRDFDYDI